MGIPATSRQKKVLRFFDVPFHASITSGAAGWEIGTLFSDEHNAERWRRYLYLTKDYGAESDELLSYEESALETVEVPEGWSAGEAIQVFRDEIAAQILASQSPYDTPPPSVQFAGHSFCFTGKFDFGPRKECEALVKEKGGVVAKGVTASLDYLVIGTQGSPSWKRGSYGTKIAKAIVLRRENGRPAIVSEDHCFSFL